MYERRYIGILFMKCFKGSFVVIFETSCNLIVFQLGACAEFFISTYYITRPFCAKTQKRASEMISYSYIINLKVIFISVPVKQYILVSVCTGKKQNHAKL